MFRIAGNEKFENGIYHKVILTVFKKLIAFTNDGIAKSDNAAPSTSLEVAYLK